MRVDQLNPRQGCFEKGPLVCSPKVFSDDRGFFLESWNYSRWKELLIEFGQTSGDFVQDNHSRSSLGVLRGLHYQLPPHPQGKLVRCIVGEIFDVAIDLRKSSATYLQAVGIHLTANNFKQLWIPNGFAHGFLTLSQTAEVLYKTTDFWSPECERSIRWDDPRIAINWPSLSTSPFLSSKDAQAPLVDNIPMQDFFE